MVSARWDSQGLLEFIARKKGTGESKEIAHIKILETIDYINWLSIIILMKSNTI